MRKIIVSEFVTLDGVIEAPNQWSFQSGRSEDQLKFKWDELFACDALLLGRVTYQEFAAAWPTMPGTGAYGERMNSLPKYVVSTTLSEMTWNATLITGDLTEELPRLKQEARQIARDRSEEHTSELQSPDHLVCLLLLDKKNTST